MVPTITLPLKISRGLGCRPEELLRDRYRDALESRATGRTGVNGASVTLCAGECAELEGEWFAFSSVPADPVAALLSVWPIGHLTGVLGAPNAAPRPCLRPAQPQA
jgi:hypothetical protein